MHRASCVIQSLFVAGALTACGERPAAIGSRTHDAGRSQPQQDARAPGWDTGVQPPIRYGLLTQTPPLGSGSLVALSDGVSVAASCADTDRVDVVSVDPVWHTRAIDLPPGSGADRLVEDGAGRIHVVLRGAGAIATIAPGATEATVRAVCAAPRGIAFRASDDSLVVACREGVIVTLPASGGPVTSRHDLGVDDLRDVVIVDDHLLVSRFRSAEVLVVDAAFALLSRSTPPNATAVDPFAPFDPTTPPMAELAPHVAWRMIPGANGAWLLHQRHRITPIPASTTSLAAFGGAYYGGGGAGAIVESVVSFVGAYGAISDVPAPATGLGLATDVTIGGDGHGVASSDGSLVYVNGRQVSLLGNPERVVVYPMYGDRDPQMRVVTIDARTAADTGRATFHTVTSSGLACASCHPEGGDDGHVWALEDRTPVRTQSLVGGVLSTAPFHWEGDLPDFRSLLHEVLEVRMGGGVLSETDSAALAQWIDALPVPPSPDVDPAAVERGRALFVSTDVGCIDCHSGDQHTNGATVDVGTGGAFQVPRLVGVSLRAPYFHDGCATSLRERFTAPAACTGGDAHGHVSALSSAEIDDLVTYLRSL